MHWKIPREMVIKYWQNNPPEKKAGNCDVIFYKTPQRMRLVSNIKQNLPLNIYKRFTDLVGTPQMKKDLAR